MADAARPQHPAPGALGRHHRTASDIDLTSDVRARGVSTFVAERRTALERDAAAVEADIRARPRSRRSALGDATVYKLIAGIDRVGRALFYGVLRSQGFRSIYWNTRCGRIHALQCSLDTTKILPPAVIMSGMGSGSTDYILLLLKLKAWFQQVTVVELVGHAYSTATDHVNAENVTASYRYIFDSLCSEQKPIFLIGHSLGGRLALDYVTGAGRDIGLAETADQAARPSGSAQPRETGFDSPSAASATNATGSGSHHYSLSQPSPAFSCVMHKRVCGLVLCAAMGAPFSAHDLEKLNTLYGDVQHWRQAAAISRGAAGTTFTDPVMAGATYNRMRKPAVRQLVASDLFQQGVPDNELRAIRVPTLLLWGEKDGLVPGEHLAHYLANLPETASIKLLPHMSHNNFAMAHGPAVRAMLRFCYRVLAVEAPLGLDNARAAADILRLGEGLGGPAAGRWRIHGARLSISSPEAEAAASPATARIPVPDETAADARDRVSSLTGSLHPEDEQQPQPEGLGGVFSSPSWSLVHRYRVSTGGGVAGSGPVMYAVRGAETSPVGMGAYAGRKKRGGVWGFFSGLCGHHEGDAQRQGLGNPLGTSV